MTPWQWARNQRPAGLLFYGVLGALLFVLVGFPILFPDGVQVGGPASEEGLLTVGDGGWDSAHFQSRAFLIENEALRPQGRQKGAAKSCIDPGAQRPSLDRALGQARKDRGRRALWVKLAVTTRWGSNRCIDSTNASPRRGRRYGTYYRVISVQAAQPISCGYLRFVRNNRRCPAPPAPPPPPRIEGSSSYPAKALQRGAEGRVTIEALIGTKGGLIECKPVASSGNLTLDRAACGVFAENIATYSGRGSTVGLAAGVRRIRTTVRFELDRSAPTKAAPPAR